MLNGERPNSHPQRPASDEAHERGSSWVTVVSFLFTRARLMTLVIVTVTGLTALITYLQPYSYTSRGVVLIERGKSPTFRSDPLNYPLEGPEVINSEIGIIKSRTVAERVVDRLDPESWPRKDNSWTRLRQNIGNLLVGMGLTVRLDAREKLIRALDKKVKAKQIPNSSLLTISFPSDDPEFSARVAGAVMDVYIERHREIYGDTSASFFEERIRQTQQRMTELSQKISKETKSAELETLEFRLAALKETHQFYWERLDRALADQGGDVSLVNVRAVDYPSAPKRPDYSRLFRILLAFLGSIVFAVAVSLVWGYFDHTVYGPEDISRPDIPVLGSVARSRSAPDLKRAEG